MKNRKHAAKAILVFALGLLMLVGGTSTAWAQDADSTAPPSEDTTATRGRMPMMGMMQNGPMMRGMMGGGMMQGGMMQGGPMEMNDEM